MRSRIDTPSTGHDVFFSLPQTGAISPDIHRLAQDHRAMVIGSALADAIVWLVRLPARLRSDAAGTAVQPTGEAVSARR